MCVYQVNYKCCRDILTIIIVKVKCLLLRPRFSLTHVLSQSMSNIYHPGSNSVGLRSQVRELMIRTNL